ncbi:MAG TPA: hypothetical protein VL132_23120 [Planctomycetaceae bacterium]|nr:hypothetical protein [Planctomycetaceae bacterium]
MIQLREHPSKNQASEPRGGSASHRDLWTRCEQELEQWVRTRPGIALGLAATAGAVLAWMIKRRV